MIFIEDDQMVETLPAYAADQAFREWILERRPRRDDHFLDAHPCDSLTEILAIDTVPVAHTYLEA
jgi:hypothetical protein